MAPAVPIFAHYADSQGKYVYSLQVVCISTTQGLFPMLVLFDNKLQNVHVLPNLISVDYTTPDTMRLRSMPPPKADAKLEIKNEPKGRKVEPKNLKQEDE